MTARKANWTGMNWISQHKRLAIYLRDGLACAYCGLAVEDGAQLTLDHVKCHVRGGCNDASNLVTCCHRCNSSRSSRSLQAFAKAVASYLNHDTVPATILAHVKACTRRQLDVPAAKAMIAKRGCGSCARVLAKKM